MSTISILKLTQQNFTFHTYYYYTTRLTASSRIIWISWYQKGKTSLDLNQTRDGGVLGCSGISWTICKQGAPHCRQITTPTPHHLIFTGQMLFLTPNQQCQSTERQQSLWCISLITASIAQSTKQGVVFRFVKRRYWGFSPHRSDMQHQLGGEWNLAWRSWVKVHYSVLNFTSIGTELGCGAPKNGTFWRGAMDLHSTHPRQISPPNWCCVSLLRAKSSISPPNKSK